MLCLSRHLPSNTTPYLSTTVGCPVCPISSPCPSRVTGGQDRRVLVGSYSKMLYLQKKATLGMHVIKKKTLDAYPPQYPDTAEPLPRCRKLMERQAFRDLTAVRAVWPTADFVDPYTIFNIKGNHYRLLTIIHYRYKRVYIQGFFTHAAYERWTRTQRQG